MNFNSTKYYRFQPTSRIRLGHLCPRISWAISWCLMRAMSYNVIMMECNNIMRLLSCYNVIMLLSWYLGSFCWNSAIVIRAYWLWYNGRIWTWDMKYRMHWGFSPDYLDRGWYTGIWSDVTGYMTKHIACGFVWKWFLVLGAQELLHIAPKRIHTMIAHWANWILAKADGPSSPGNLGISWDNPTWVKPNYR